MSLFALIFLIVAAGVVAWLIGKAPFIAEPYKTFAQYALLVVVVLYILFSFLGGGFHDVRIPTIHK